MNKCWDVAWYVKGGIGDADGEAVPGDPADS